jgi:negative regulator of flagellin synthesis FlgM
VPAPLPEFLVKSVFQPLWCKIPKINPKFFSPVPEKISRTNPFIEGRIYMKINGRDNNIINLDKAFSGDRIRKSELEKNADQVQKGEQTNAAGDMVKISSKGAQIQQIKSMLENIPDIRQDQVDVIKRNMESGNYQVNSDKIAHAMIREDLMNHLL